VQSCWSYHSDPTDASLCPLSWLQDTPGLHGDIFRRRGWYRALDLDLDQPFQQWSVIGPHWDFHCLRVWSVTETIAEHLYITGYYHHDIELCVGYVTAPYNADIWIPPFVFEAILALLALWAGIKHSRQQSRSQSARFNRPRLVDSLVHGNVIYFVRCELPYHCWIGIWQQDAVRSSYLFYFLITMQAWRFNGWHRFSSGLHQSRYLLAVVLFFQSERRFLLGVQPQCPVAQWVHLQLKMKGKIVALFDMYRIIRWSKRDCVVVFHLVFVGTSKATAKHITDIGLARYCTNTIQPSMSRLVYTMKGHEFKPSVSLRECY